MGSTNTTYAQNAAYAPFGPLKTYIAGNGLPIINQYDTDYQLTTLKAGAVVNRDYQNDETGNVTQISNMGVLPVSSPETMAYAYQNNNNQLTQAINGTNTTYGYNAAGNLITELKNTVTRTYTYNYSQRLVSVTEDSSTLGQYTYDALGRRTKKIAGGVTTLYLYDQTGLLIAEYDGSGTWQKDYVYLNSQPLAMIVASSPENVYYYHNDHLGTPQVMTDSTGTVVWAATYEPFGKATITVEQITNNLRFPGQYFDAETGLHYNYYRNYYPKLGRYIETDPVGLDEFGDNLGTLNHLYVYVLSNPVNWFDIFGLKRIVICLDKDSLTLYDDNGKVVFDTSIVHGCEKTPTPTGKFILGDWIKDLTSKKWGWQSATPWSKSWWGGNVFGPYYVPVGGAGNIGIHGTLGPRGLPLKKRPWECGSHGCIRVTNRDIIKLHDELLPKPKGTVVEIKEMCK
jgi:RHS repeat-associated protein